MGTIQEEFDNLLKQYFQPENIGAELVKKKLKSVGVELTEEQLENIGSQFAQVESNSFHLELEDDQVFKAGFKNEQEFQKVASSLFGDLVSDLEKFIKDFNKDLPTVIRETSEEISEKLLITLKKNAPEMLNGREMERVGFEANLYSVWGRAFDLLEMLIVLSLEAGNLYNSEYRVDAASENDIVFDALIRLHARSCQVASEILALLKTGHADGAHARWRSLHEITVTGILIGNHNNELAERYLLHDGIETYKAAKIYQQYCENLGYEPLTGEELTEMTKEYNYLVDRYGKSYKNEYGWASTVIDKDRPTFKDIEETVGLDHLRPYYKMACHNVHANPRGIFFKLGLYPETGDILLAGPSNVGLTDPGHSAALSLCQITVSLLTHDPNLDRLVQCQILMNLEKEIGDAFREAERKLKDSV